MAAFVRANLTLEFEGDAQNVDLTLVRPFRIFNCHAVVVTQAATTTTLQRQALGAGAFNAVSSAISDNAAVGTLTNTASLAAAEDDAVATDVLRAAGSGAGRSALYVAVLPRAI